MERRKRRKEIQCKNSELLAYSRLFLSLKIPMNVWDICITAQESS